MSETVSNIVCGVRWFVLFVGSPIANVSESHSPLACRKSCQGPVVARVSGAGSAPTPSVPFLSAVTVRGAMTISATISASRCAEPGAGPAPPAPTSSNSACQSCSLMRFAGSSMNDSNALQSTTAAPSSITMTPATERIAATRGKRDWRKRVKSVSASAPAVAKASCASCFTFWRHVSSAATQALRSLALTSAFVAWRRSARSCESCVVDVASGTSDGSSSAIASSIWRVRISRNDSLISRSCR